MAKQDFVPRQDPDFVTWFQNFKTQLAAVAATVGLLPADVTASDNDFTLIDGKINALAAAKAAQQSAAADKIATRTLVESRLRALVRRVKAHGGYTIALGEQLGVVGPEDTTDLNTAKPTLKATSVLAGAVTIGFNKSISSGIKIWSKRGAEPAFTFLATDTTSPYVDNRANLAAGPELRQYQAQYLDGDEAVGLVSDTLSVTVPG
ncbi:MAG: hypothetical protein L0211_19635 [Planctomycetaceae bacterium]|nr:hypothetical protein [Planctomycetaceae bacterium]